MSRTKEIQDFVDNIAENIFGRTLSESQEKNICVSCGGEVNEQSFEDELSKKEYQISGLCQKCQNDIFGKE